MVEREAKDARKEIRKAGEASGRVDLVGAGPSAELITRAGLRALRRAEVVLYDALLDPVLLDEAGNAEKVPVGKRFGKHSAPQEDIIAYMLKRAGEGKRVVRLKGGDAFVFGRGGEEAMALLEAGIPFSVIPGISSCIAVPELAGIPVTHRGLARSFTVVTGSTQGGEAEPFRCLAGLSGTLVFLMAHHRLKEITDSLLQCGKDPDTPSSVISRGGSADQLRIDGTLSEIARLAAGAPTPSILVIGEAASFHLNPDAISFMVNNREADEETFKETKRKSDEVVDEEAGKETKRKIDEGTDEETDGVTEQQLDESTDKETDKDTEQEPDEAAGEEADEGTEQKPDEAASRARTTDTQKTEPSLRGVRVAVTGSEHFTQKIAERLRKEGACVQKIETMRIVPRNHVVPENASCFDWIVFTSANGVRIFYEAIRAQRKDLRAFYRTRFACVGSGTAEALQAGGIRADFLPKQYTTEQLGRELADYLRDRNAHEFAFEQNAEGCDACEQAEQENTGRRNAHEYDSDENVPEPNPSFSGWMGEKSAPSVLLLRSSEGSRELPKLLRQAGLKVTDHVSYDPVPVHSRAVLDASCDYIVFGSAGSARAFFEIAEEGECSGLAFREGRADGKIVPVCIGSVTEQAVRACMKALEKLPDSECGSAEKETAAPVILGDGCVTAREFTIDGVLDAILEHERRSAQTS